MPQPLHHALFIEITGLVLIFLIAMVITTLLLIFAFSYTQIPCHPHHDKEYQQWPALGRHTGKTIQHFKGK